MKAELNSNRGFRVTVECEFTELVAIGEVKEHPRNPNKHPERQIAMMADLIRRIGWRYPIVVSKLSGCIVSGHGRLYVARRLELTEVPVDYQDFKNEGEEYCNCLPIIGSRN